MPPMACVLHYNEDYTQVVLELANGSSFEAEDIPEEGELLFVDPDDGRRYLAVLSNYADDDQVLQPDQVYELRPLDTQVEASDGEQVES